MKKISALLLWLFVGWTEAMACEVCKTNQPKVLQGITHGTGAQSDFDYVIIWTAVILVTLTFLLALKYLIKPKENDPNHIKNIIVEQI
ncbi:MAG: hypothetical protein JST48_08640 [Bacteroidetes bacterium]|nr:hypothetical protein [Bacteroidota bacterium]